MVKKKRKVPGFVEYKFMEPKSSDIDLSVIAKYQLELMRQVKLMQICLIITYVVLIVHIVAHILGWF